MSESTKQGRALIYNFLEAKGIDFLPFRSALRKLLVNYAKEENAELLAEVEVLREKTRKYRAIIKDLQK